MHQSHAIFTIFTIFKLLEVRNFTLTCNKMQLNCSFWWSACIYSAQLSINYPSKSSQGSTWTFSNATNWRILYKLLEKHLQFTEFRRLYLNTHSISKFNLFFNEESLFIKKMCKYTREKRSLQKFNRWALIISAPIFLHQYINFSINITEKRETFSFLCT